MIQEIKENTVPNHPDEWTPPVLKTSASAREGVSEVIQNIFLHNEYENKNPLGKELRYSRLKKEVLQNMLMMAELKFKNEVEKISQDDLEQLYQGMTTAMFIANGIYEKNIK